MPDEDFIAYYKKIGIITDSIQYSDNQYKNALEKFKTGKDELFPIIKAKYFSEVKEYYVEKLQQIIDKEELDYYSYYYIVNDLTNYFNEDYHSGNYILNDAITSEKFDDYDKKEIMKYLLEVVKNWKQ